MILPDVNVLVYAFRKDAALHQIARDLLNPIFASSAQFGVSPLALSALVRITTNTRVLATPSSLEDAFGFCNDILQLPNCRVLAPGDRHWEIFQRLCIETRTRGNTVSDVWYAALAIEWACEWVTFDRDFLKFPGLNCRLLPAQPV